MPQSILSAIDSPEDALAQLDALIGNNTEITSTGHIEPMPWFEHTPADEHESPQNSRLRILRVFQEQTPLRLQGIEQAMTNGDWHLVAILVHGIKGSVAQIYPKSELVALSARLEDMADALALEDFRCSLAHWKAQVAQCLQSAASEIHVKTSNAHASADKALPPLDCALLDELAELLIQRDARASDVASKLAPYFLNTAQHGAWVHMDNAIGRYDFKSALDALNALNAIGGLKHVK